MAVTPRILQDPFKLRLAASYPSPEYATDRLPYVYGWLKGGSGGVSYCPCIDTTAHRYLISDAPIVAAPAAQIYVDEVEVLSGWTVTPDYTDGAGRHIAVVEFGSSRLGSRIGYRGKGIKDGAGALIENPIAVAKDLLVNRRGLLEADIEATAYATAFARAAAQGYVAAGVLDQDRSLAYTLAELLGPFLGAALLTADRRVAFSLDTGGAPRAEQVAHHFAGASLTGVHVVYERRNIVNQAAIAYCLNSYATSLTERYQAEDDGSATADAVSQAVHGALGPGLTTPRIEAPWIRDAATVQAIQAVMVAKWKDPRFLATFTDASWRASHLETGDVGGFSWPWLFDDQGQALKNQLVRLEAIRPDPRAKTVRCTVSDLGYYLTRAYLADGTVLADGTCAAGGERDRRDYAA